MAKWLLRGWSVFVFMVIVLIHILFLVFVPDLRNEINTWASSACQLVGGGIILVVLISNIGILRQKNPWLMLREWIASIPLRKKSVYINAGVASARFDGVTSTAIGYTKNPYRTIEEGMQELERQIDGCRNLILEREKFIMDQISQNNTKYEESLSKIKQEIDAIQKSLNEIILGSVQLEIFGGLLVVYGVIINI